MGAEMAEQFVHVKHCTTHPKFLHSNSTSHRWVFGAIAELIDNAIDPDVSASQFCIDMKEFNGEPCLVFMDNGCGLTPERLHKMLSFGHSKKQLTPGDRSIGKHGNGFKSGTMRLGKDVLVLTKCVTSMTAGFLSQSFLLDTGAEDILIPQVSWDLNGNRLCDSDLDADESLSAICSYSIFPDEESLLAQLEAIPQTGAILIISNLRRHEGHLELDFKTDPHDIRITSEISSSNFQQLRPNQPNSVDVATDYSLRAYVAILYKVPRMQIFIRDKKVKTKRISGLLSMKEMETYKPVGVSETLKIELGFNTDNKNLYGMMLYHRNRLIKPYMRVGIQLEENERGMGVIGIVEADFLQPTHNKQDFDDTIAYRRLLKKLSDVLAEYWWEKKERNTTALVQVEPRVRRPGQGPSSEDVPDVVWVQCDNPTCLKWRVLPNCADPAALPDIWYCDYHPDPKFRRHEEPEQEWDASIPHEIVERRKERKREYDREKKEREAQKKRQRLDAASREEQVSMQKQREAMQRELEEKLAREKMAQEQERRRQEEEVKKLNEECKAMKAKQQEMLEKQLELQRQLQLANEEKARQEELARQNQEREEQEELARQERERQEYEEQQEQLAKEKRQQEEIAKQQRLKAQQDERARQEKERQEYEARQEELARQDRERKEIELQKEEAARLQRAYESQQQELQRQERLRQQEYEEQQEEAVRQARVRQQEYDAHQQRELVRQRQNYEAQQEELVRQEYTRRQEDYERSDRLRQEYEAHLSAKDQSQDRTGMEGHNSEDHLTLGLVTQYGIPEGLDGINELQDSSLQAEDLRKGSQRQKSIRDQQLLVQNQGLGEPHRGQPNAIQHHYMLPDTMQGAQELQLIDSNSLSETLMTRSSSSQQPNKSAIELAALRSFGSRVPSGPQGSQQSHGDLLKQMAANGMSMAVQRYEGAERQTSTPRGLHPTSSALMPPTPSPTHMPSFASVNSSVPGQVQNSVRTSSSAAPLAEHFRQSLASKQGTSQAVSPFQEMSLQPLAVNDSMYESRVQTIYNDRVEAENQQTAQFSGLSTVTRGDLNDQQANGAGYYGRPGDAQPSGMLSGHLPLESGLSNTSSTTDASLDQVVFVLQRRLKAALNTLEKIGGALEPNLLDMASSLPSTDLEVLSICEKAKNLVEMRSQAYRDEITRLKTQLSYYTQSNPQGSVEKPRSYNF